MSTTTFHIPPPLNDSGDWVIITEYLEGKSYNSIGKGLTKDGIRTVTGNERWWDSTVSGILSNEKYYGDALLQKNITKNYLKHKRANNKGEAEQYMIEENHPPIISKETFDAVQAEKARRAIKFSIYKGDRQKYTNKYPFSGKVFCGDCGNTYRRRAWNSNNKSKNVGVDFTKDFIDDAVKTAKSSFLEIDFILADIRDLKYDNEFDVVLNLADGAIGYLESDEENLKIFDVISRALKPDGKRFMDICNAEHAEICFPKRNWDIGSKMLSLPEFDWDKEKRRILFKDWGITFGEIAKKPETIPEDTTGIRLYSKAELDDIFRERKMQIIKTYSNYYGKEASYKEIQLMVYSKKNK